MPPDYAVLSQRASSLDSSSLRDALQSVLDDLSSGDCVAPVTSLRTLKLLGRNHNGSELLATTPNLQILVRYARIAPSGSSKPLYDAKPSPKRNADIAEYAGALEQAVEAFRVIANALLLHQSARNRLAQIDGVPYGLVKSLGFPAPDSFHFLAARTLFLMTAGGEDLVVTLVEDLNIGVAIGECLESYPPDIINDDPEKTPNPRFDSLTEHLKLLFNITLWYPRLLTISYRQQASTLSPHPSRPSNAQASLEHSSAPGSSRSSSPLPASESSTKKSQVRNLFSRASGFMMGSRDGSDSDKEDSSTKKHKGKGKSVGKSPASPPLEGPAALLDNGFEGAFQCLVNLALSLSLPSVPAPKPPLSKVLECLLNFPLVSSFSSAMFGPAPSYAPQVPYVPTASPSKPPPVLPPLVARLLILLDSTTRFFIENPEDMDSDEIRRKETATDIQLEATISNIVLLIRKCCVEESERSIKQAVRSCILPEDIDRSKPLEQRNDLTGRLIRTLSSVYLNRSRDSIGEFLFSLCNQDPREFALTIGYGNASGFLASANLLIPPPAHDSDDPRAAQDVDEITGATRRKPGANEERLKEMTEDEKEVEAERMYTLFERLRRTGVVETKNPVHEAQESGRLQELTEEEEKEEAVKAAAQEEADEEEAHAEMKRYRERKAGG